MHFHTLLAFSYLRALRIVKPAGSGLLALSWKLRPCTPLFLPPTVQESSSGKRGDCGRGLSTLNQHNIK